ncbi:MAG: hypothetical protein K9N23_08065 [Akkermansiaceae bacterium]|nr:hypothetical protein [Akkermansiaceae bacterium]
MQRTIISLASLLAMPLAVLHAADPPPPVIPAKPNIIYFIIDELGDNGQAHARGKQFCYEEGLHVPMIIRWPRNFPVPKQIKPP